MRFSRAFIPTLKEIPSEAEVVSHQLMLRAGMIRKVAAGIYNWLPLGYRSLRKVERIVREEMDAAGCQEVFMPFVQPASLWQESGRWLEYGKELRRIKDRHDNEYTLGPTHEEVITDMVRGEVRSYRDLPLNLYQIQTKFRDEIRPRFGIMRAREFMMKDGYSFDVDDEASAESYQQMRVAYNKVFTRCGFRYKMVEADSGAIGGKFSHEFMVLAETGEDEIASCTACDYAANLERAEVTGAGVSPAAPSAEARKVETPGAHTVEKLAQMLGIANSDIAKTMIYSADGQPVAAMVRGDREVNEIKLKNALGCIELEMAPPEMIGKVSGGGVVGFVGPLGLSCPIYADFEVAKMTAMVVGANAGEDHITGVNLGRDFGQAKLMDLRNIAPGDPCPRCGGEMEFARGIEVGHIFRLGTKYSEKMNARFLDPEGQRKAMVMGCYGIGVSRVLAASIEQNHDDNGIIWPLPIAPFSVAVLVMKPEGAALAKAEEIYEQLKANGVDAILDDRDVRPGVKFKDVDLLGIPFRVVVGDKGLKAGELEFKDRATGVQEVLPLDQAVEMVVAKFRAGGGQSI